MDVTGGGAGERGREEVRGVVVQHWCVGRMR